MQVYDKNDIDVFNESVKEIIDRVKYSQLELFEPTKIEMDKIMGIINTFIKSKKRKVYGGYALNLLLKDKDPKDAIYNDIEFADIDFYSPEPIHDLIELCNILQDEGVKSPMAQEAQHPETYSIFANQQLFCDITYVPRNIYNRMPFVELEGFNVIHPHFMMIDFFRMFTDPLLSYWRLEKTMPRYYKLQRHYPFIRSDRKISFKPLDDEVYREIEKILKNRENLIVVGGYAYNKFLEESKLDLPLLKNPPFEVVTTDYEKDGGDIIDRIKKTTFSKDIRVVEHYPFFQFISYSVIVYHKNDPILIISGNNKKCYPCKQICIGKDDFTQIGSFDLTLMFCMFHIIIHRTNKEMEKMNSYQRFLTDMIDMRKYFFKKNPKLTFNDDTLFKSFQVECIGTAVDAARERRDLIKEKKKNKIPGPLIFRYEPEMLRKEPDSNFIFANTSGNAINNVKNLQLNKSV